MIEFRPILYLIGLLICAVGVAMAIPSAVDFMTGAFRGPEPFLIAAISSVALGGMLVLANRGPIRGLSLRQAYMLTFLAWVVTPAIAALPLMFSQLELSYTDAFFETMSGITTTGSTILVGLDDMPPSILLWRALTQWLGGIGIVVMAIAVLPLLRTGGMQLFKTESSDRSDKPFPRIAQLASALCLVYVLLTLLNTIAYRAAGMTGFEAIAHAMTTISTGGYSTSDRSIGNFGAGVQWVAVLFMLAGALPFVLYIRLLRGEWVILHDRQVRTMLLVIAGFVLLLTWWLWQVREVPFLTALRLTSVNVTSILTTTGYADGDYGQWGGFAIALFLFLMFIGGCTGSTSGGIKLFRFLVMGAVLRDHLERRFMPHKIKAVYYDGRLLTPDISEGVMAFILVYGIGVALGTAGLAATGLDWVTSLSGAAQALGNVGPGLGPIIGPAGNFAPLPDAAKWLLSFGMLLGRLELFTVLVLFAPRFWRG